VTNESKDQLIGERARALATIILTRRSDLTIVDTKKDTGLDFHVSIEREDNPMRLSFGILLRGVSTPVTAEHANRVLGPTMGQFQGMRKFTCPVYLFLFTMRDERGFFAWLAEPVVTGGAPKLVHHDKVNCVELTDELLNEVVDRIVTWYDAVETMLIA
jgi:hypothetical protein